MAIVSALNYFRFKDDVSKMIKEKDKEVKSIIDKSDKEFKERLKIQMIKLTNYNNYSLLVREAHEFLFDKKYTKAFIRSLQALSIFSDDDTLNNVTVKYDEDTGLVMSFFNNHTSYGSTLFYQVDRSGYTDFTQNDINEISKLLKLIYTDNGVAIPELFKEIETTMTKHLVA